MDTKVAQIKKIINVPDNAIRACLLKHQENVERALDELLKGKPVVTFLGSEAMGDFTLLRFNSLQKRKHRECFRKSKVFIADDMDIDEIIPQVAELVVETPVFNLASIGSLNEKSNPVDKSRLTLSSLASAGISSKEIDKAKRPSLGSLASMHLSNQKLSSLQLQSKASVSPKNLPNMGNKLSLSSLQPGNKPNLTVFNNKSTRVPQFIFQCQIPKPEPVRKKN